MKLIDPDSENPLVATGLAPAFIALGVIVVLFIAAIIAAAVMWEDPQPGPIRPACVQDVGGETRVVACP